MFEQIDQSTKDNFLRANAALIGDSHAMMSVAVDTIEQLAALNLKHAMDAVSIGAEHAFTILDTEHLHEAIALHAEQFHPASEKFLAYTVELFQITNAASSKMTSMLNAHFEEMSQGLELRSLEAAQKSLISPDIAVAVVKEASAATKNVYENALAVAKQSEELGKVHANNVPRTASKPKRSSSSK